MGNRLSQGKRGLRPSLAILAAFAFAASSVPAFAIDMDQIQKIVGNEHGNSEPGCAVGIFENGKTVLATGVGGADIATGRPINADTQFYAASVSKQFTDIAVAQLIVAGKVGMNDDIRKFIPEFPYAVTVAELMHHTSGVPDVLGLIHLAGHEVESTVPRPDALKLLLGMKHPNFQPGTSYSYSNGGYFLLAEIVERVSKMPFHEYMARNIFEKLGMKRTFVLHGQYPTDPNVAHGYVVRSGKTLLVDTYPLFGGSGGVQFTINDIAKYDRDIQVEHKIWTPEIAKILLEPGKFADGSLVEVSPGRIYAGGLRLGDGWAWHTGGAEGFSNFYGRFPARKFGVVFLCNTGRIDAIQKAEKVVEAFGGMTSLNAPYPGLPSPDGRFTSPDLPVFYDVKLADKTLTIDIISRTDGKPGKGFTLNQQQDGSFLSGNRMRVTFDHKRNGFQLEDGVITVSFERVRQ